MTIGKEPGTSAIDKFDSAKARQTECRRLGVGTTGINGLLGLKTYRAQHEEPSSKTDTSTTTA